MRRGDIVLADVPGDYSGKRRPFLIIQSDDGIELTTAITACPITTTLLDTPLSRPFLAPDAGNGLQHPSQVQADRPITFHRRRIVERVGAASPRTMAAVDAALRRWLAL